jgi:hypothetical protein
VNIKKTGGFCAADDNAKRGKCILSVMCIPQSPRRARQCRGVRETMGGTLSNSIAQCQTTSAPALRTDNCNLSRRQLWQERENLGHQQQRFIVPLAGTKSNRAWNVGKSPCTMPEADNLNLFLVTPQPIDNAIGTADNFAQIRLPEFRHLAADFRKIRQTFGAGDQFKTEPGCGIGIMLGNVADDLRQICLRRGRDDYLPAHEAILALTCSMGMPSPRSNSSSPCCTA